jgi:transposase-like protein
MIQRCQVHKRRNVIDHLPEEHKSAVKKKLQNAHALDLTDLLYQVEC